MISYRKLGVVAGAALLGGAVLAAVPQTDRTIYVSAMGSNGMPVMDLAPTDFTVSEDNVAREVVKVGKAEEPVYYAVLVDTSSGSGNSDGDRSRDRANATDMVQHLRDALTGFTKLVLQAAPPNSKILLMEFGGAGQIRQDFTSDFAALEPVIPKLLPKPSEPVLNEALAEAAKQLAKVPTRRRVIVSINREPTVPGTNMDGKLVAEEVRKSGATVWGLSVRYGNRQDANHDNVLKGLAANSGGVRLTLGNPIQLADYLRSVAANTIVQYAVTIKRPADAPAITKDSRTLVKINRPGVTPLTLLWSDK
jgi:hypothetical protein